MKKALLIPALLLLAACTPKNTTTTENAGESKDTIVITAPVKEEAAQTKTIEGEVLEIQNGKDGYTAKIKANDNETYFATISHANLKDPAQYKTFKIGDKVKVAGDFWKMENENHITTREIQ